MYRCGFCNRVVFRRSENQSHEMRLKEHFLACRLTHSPFPLRVQYCGLGGFNTRDCSIVVVFLLDKKPFNNRAFIQHWVDYDACLWELSGNVQTIFKAASFAKFQSEAINMVKQAYYLNAQRAGQI